MELDKDDLAVLCQGMSRDEVDRVHRLLRDWGVGPDNSFPVQLALLTGAQLRAAASVPRSIAESRQWLEQHLAGYGRQTKLLFDDFGAGTRRQSEELKAITEEHAQTLQDAVFRIKLRLTDADTIAGRVKSSLDAAAAEWQNVFASTAAQREELRQIADGLQNRFAWQAILGKAIWFLLILAVGLLAGHYAWPP
jgi:hypothetical protein